MSNWVIAKIGGAAVLILTGSILFLMSMYTIDEGHVGIVKVWGKATNQVSPGLHFKMPIAQSVEEIDVRTRKSEENMSAATSEQMPAQAHVSLNWTVVAAETMDLYKSYGGLEQFENRIIDPRLRSSAKAAISKYTAEELIQERGGVISSIEEDLKQRLESYVSVVSVDSVQLENVELPPRYLEAIAEKQNQKTLADAESHKLRRQQIEVQQQVNTAMAERDSAKAIADGKAYATQVQAKAEAESVRIRGLAEAEAMKAQAEAVASSPALVEYIRAKNWNGQMPATMMGSTPDILWSMQ